MHVYNTTLTPHAENILFTITNKIIAQLSPSKKQYRGMTKINIKVGKSTSFLDIFMISDEKEVAISNHWRKETCSWDWGRLRRMFFYIQIKSLFQLWDKIETASMRSSDDKVLWQLENSGDFSVKSNFL